MMQLNADQQNALNMIDQFVHHDTQHHAFILKGSAGTGKTTMIKSIVAMIDKMNERSDTHIKRSVRVLAPTGRAARVLSEKLQPRFSANTIHREIYALDKAVVYQEAVNQNDPGIRFHFPLKTDNPSNVIFIVDESSMVGDTDNRADDIHFGSGMLLKDLITYARLVRAGREEATDCKIIFVGDPAQLPPVGNGDLSPAMSSAYLAQHYGIQTQTVDLKQVMRQAEGSGILSVATGLRDDIVVKKFNHFDITRNTDIQHLSMSSAFEAYLSARQQKKTCVFISHSNAQVTSLNTIIRGLIWGEEGLPIQKNEILLVNRNSRVTYIDQSNNSEYQSVVSLSNGELVKVVDFADAEKRHIPVRIKIDNALVSEIVSLSFRRVSFQVKDVTGQLLLAQALIIENLLESKERELSPLEVRALLIDFRMRNPHLKPNTEAFTKAISNDPYFNAVQVKYGYAMTCHKAQGGEWDEAFVEFGSAHPNEFFFRWAYTAITRAKTKLSVVNAPKFTPTSQIKFSGSNNVRTMPNHVTTGVTASHHAITTAPVEASRPWQKTASHIPAIPTTPAPTQAVQQSNLDFSGQPIALYRYYQALNDALQAIGIQIVQVIHQQYRERYCLARAEVSVCFEYLYKGNYQVSGINSMAQQPNQIDLLAQVMPIIQKVLYATDSEDPLSTQELPPFISLFITQIQQIIAPTNIKLVKHDLMNYRLRLYFAQDTHRASIDFNYNSKEQWTTASEVGGFGTSKGIFQLIQAEL